MKKVFIAAALAAMIVSCGSTGNKSAEIIAESQTGTKQMVEIKPQDF